MWHMSKFEFTWTDDEQKVGHFSTSCPDIGEVFMKSHGAGFPKLPADIKASFDELYGTERGKFEAILKDKMNLNTYGEIETGIRGLCVRLLSGFVIPHSP